MIVWLDFESHYDTEYSLSKMPTAQYIRDPRWRCLGCAVAIDDRPGIYVQPEQLPALFAAVDWQKATAVAHNATFDGAVLHWHYGRAPRQWLDTKLVARYLISQGYLGPDQTTSLAELAPLVGMTKGDTWGAVKAGGQALADYGLDDLDIMRALVQQWRRDGLLATIPTLEWQLMDLHVRCATEPVLDVDTAVLEAVLAEREQSPELYKALRKDANFATLLERFGIEPRKKTTPKGNEKYAFASKDAQMLELLEHTSPYVSRAAELKLEAHSSINHTRAARLLAVGAPLPVPELYYGAHTGRSAGEDKMNMLNMPRAPKDPARPSLRQAVRAQPGYKLVIVDSGQIEARMVNYLAGQDDALERFRRADRGEDVDPYRVFAGQYLYHVDPREIGKGDERRQIAKAAVLALGFGQGPGGFMNYCAGLGIDISYGEAERVVQIYRASHRSVVALKRQYLDTVLRTGQQTLLTGRKLLYPDIHTLREHVEGVEGMIYAQEMGRPIPAYRRAAIFSKGAKGARNTVKLWGGFCLSLDTLLLTQAGWVRLANVGSAPVWDGVEWVAHEGLTTPQYKTTIHRHGVRLTPDHEVLTDAGWRTAGESEEHPGPYLQMADGGAVCGKQWAPEPMGMSVSVRGYKNLHHQVPSQRGRQQLRIRRVLPRLPIRRLQGHQCNAWHEPASGVLGVAEHAGPVLSPLASGVAQLRRAWRDGVRALGAIFRSLLGRHGGDLPPGPVDRPHRQRPWILPAELPVGYALPAGQKQAVQPGNAHAMGQHDGGRSKPTVRDKSDHPALPAGRGVAARGSVSEAVADLKNCGPRNRFIVCAPGGIPFIAHNCVENRVQADARDVVLWQTAQLKDQYRVVMSTYDEAVFHVPEADAETCLADALAMFATAPPFAPGIPVVGEGVISDHYGAKP